MLFMLNCFADKPEDGSQLVTLSRLLVCSHWQVKRLELPGEFLPIEML